MDSNITGILGFVNLLFVGLLAGEEFIIRYGVRAAVASLDDRSHIRLRQTLILNMRILVPTIFALAFLTGITITVLHGFDTRYAYRAIALLALLTFITVTLTGTVPINEAALTWDPAAPPQNWQARVKRWEQFDTIRAWAAMTAFALLIVAMPLH